MAAVGGRGERGGEDLKAGAELLLSVRTALLSLSLSLPPSLSALSAPLSVSLSLSLSVCNAYAQAHV